MARIRRHPLARALRLDKLGMVALVATLAHYRRGDAERSIPIWRMIGASAASLAVRAEGWARVMGEAGLTCEVRSGQSAIGGGSMPGVTLPTTVVRVGGTDGAEVLARRLRRARPNGVPIVGRIDDGGLVLDPRTVVPGDDELVMRAVIAAVSGTRRAHSREHD